MDRLHDPGASELESLRRENAALRREVAELRRRDGENSAGARRYGLGALLKASCVSTSVTTWTMVAVIHYGPRALFVLVALALVLMFAALIAYSLSDR